MTQMKTLLAIILALAVLGCSRKSEICYIRIGQPIGEVYSIMKSCKATEVPVSYLMPLNCIDRWYETKNNTCIHIRFMNSPINLPCVSMIEVGETGKGYGGIMSWEKQKIANVNSVAVQ
jgi:hypothetical protein